MKILVAVVAVLGLLAATWSDAEARCQTYIINGKVCTVCTYGTVVTTTGC